MLKYRLIFGFIMAIAFVGLVLFDAHLDGSLSPETPDKPVQGTIFCILVVIMAAPANFEMAALAKKVGATVFRPITIAASVLMALSWYVRQYAGEGADWFHLHYVLFVCAFAILGLFLYQARRFGNKGVIINCSAGLFTIFYLGFLSSFVPAIRIRFGVWALLMFISAVKLADTGAYTIGRLFGKHKFSPNISPGKTWEGIAGGIGFAVIASVIFSVTCGIMEWYFGVVFGVIFAFLGQLGDLAESMIKRDAEQKDSSSSLPGFGGVLDILDSPLVTAPLAYLYLIIVCD